MDFLPNWVSSIPLVFSWASDVKSAFERHMCNTNSQRPDVQLNTTPIFFLGTRTCMLLPQAYGSGNENTLSLLLSRYFK